MGIVSHQRYRCDLVAFYAEWCGFACRESACAGFALSHLQGMRLAPYLSDGHIRRLAHLTEYTTLGVVLSSFSVLISRHSHKAWVLLIGIGVASIDEYIQLLAGGRTSTWHDVVLDGVGCIIGTFLVMVIRGVKRGVWCHTQVGVSGPSRLLFAKKYD